MTKTTDRAQSRRIRVLPEQWERIENAARGTGRTANELVIDLAMEALDRREWPRTEAEIHLLRSVMFTAQAPHTRHGKGRSPRRDRGNQPYNL